MEVADSWYSYSMFLSSLYRFAVFILEHFFTCSFSQFIWIYYNTCFYSYSFLKGPLRLDDEPSRGSFSWIEIFRESFQLDSEHSEGPLG